jgi:hypothetical protein
VIGIERVHHAGLLSRDQCALAVRESHQDRGRAEVEIGAFLVGTVGAILRGAGNVVGIALGHLARPFELSGRAVERDESIRRVLRRFRIAVTGRRVDRVGRVIDRRRGPDRAARGPELLHADRIDALRLRRRRDVAAPFQLARHGVECRDQPAKAAAAHSADQPPAPLRARTPAHRGRRPQASARR